MSETNFGTDLIKAMTEALDHAKGVDTGAVSHIVTVDAVLPGRVWSANDPLAIATIPRD